MSGKPWEIERLTMNFADLMTEDEVNAIAPMVCAAPAMARALCEVEWRGFAVDEANVCPARGCRGEEGKHSHSPDCALDAALTLAGLDVAAREEVRRGK